tara:strand:- start:692 stop:973 length:282 start_codon:yes stop_codon:yes gene_type:complete
MKIKHNKKEIIVKEITYKDKLTLQGWFSDVYKDPKNVKQKEYNTLLAFVAELAFNDPEKDLEKFDYVNQIKILTQCLMDYLGYSDKEKKGDGD